MATTLTVNGETRSNAVQVSAIIADKLGEKVHFVGTYDLNAGGGASDKTLFTVPSGKTFFLTRISATNSTAATYGAKFWDASGDSVDATKGCICRVFAVSETAAATPLQTVFSSPVPVMSGISVDSTNQPAGHLYVDIEGFLI